MTTEVISERDFEMPAEQTARAIYAHADALELRWQSARLSPSFRDRMVDAVMRHMARTQEPDLSMQTRALHARRLLSSFWSRNARRDCARRNHRTVPLNECNADSRDRLQQVHDSHMLQLITRRIISMGERQEVAMAFVLWHLGFDSQETARKVQRAVRTRISPAAIRQWVRRRFPSIRAKLRRHPDLFSIHVPSWTDQPHPRSSAGRTTATRARASRNVGAKNANCCSPDEE